MTTLVKEPGFVISDDLVGTAGIADGPPSIPPGDPSDLFGERGARTVTQASKPFPQRDDDRLGEGFSRRFGQFSDQAVRLRIFDAESHVF